MIQVYKYEQFTSAYTLYAVKMLKKAVDNRVGQKYEKSYSNLAQMFISVKFCAEQFSFYRLFDSRPSSFPKLHFIFTRKYTQKYKG